MLQAIQNHIDSHQTNGVDWPAWAFHAVVYAHSTWPCGWEKEPTIRFFADELTVQAWLWEKNDWATLEDNYFAYRAYDWDLGPVPSKQFAGSNEGNIPSGKAINFG